MEMTPTTTYSSKPTWTHQRRVATFDLSVRFYTLDTGQLYGVVLNTNWKPNVTTAVVKRFTLMSHRVSSNTLVCKYGLRGSNEGKGGGVRAR